MRGMGGRTRCPTKSATDSTSKNYVSILPMLGSKEIPSVLYSE